MVEPLTRFGLCPLPAGPPPTSPIRQGRRIVITGGNSGIGLEAARVLSGAGAQVIIAVRDPAKGQRAAGEIGDDTEVRALDLADLNSVRAFAAETIEPIDVLINNAGVMALPLSRTVQGFETQFGVNHLGHFALTNLLLPMITDRVVSVSSGAHRLGTSTSATSTGSAGAISAGRRTGSPSWPTCCSSWSSSAG